MKRIFFAIIIAGGLTTGVDASIIHPVRLAHERAAEWVKSKTQTWAGSVDSKTYWYKLDKSAKLWWSTDGNKWASVENQSWMDKEGKWLKIHEGKLVWSIDGTTWSEVPEWKWEGSDGKW